MGRNFEGEFVAEYVRCCGFLLVRWKERHKLGLLDATLAQPLVCASRNQANPRHTRTHKEG